MSRIENMDSEWARSALSNGCIIRHKGMVAGVRARRYDDDSTIRVYNREGTLMEGYDNIDEFFDTYNAPDGWGMAYHHQQLGCGEQPEHGEQIDSEYVGVALEVGLTVNNVAWGKYDYAKQVTNGDIMRSQVITHGLESRRDYISFESFIRDNPYTTGWYVIDTPEAAQTAALSEDEVDTIINSKEAARPVTKHNHYYKDVTHLNSIDVYRVIQLFDVSDPCLQHAVKKLLVAGGRGAGKDIKQDVQEAIDTLVRWQEMQTEGVVQPTDDEAVFYNLNGQLDSMQTSCTHDNVTHQGSHIKCDECGAVKIHNDDRWFISLTTARSYRNTGRLPTDDGKK